MVLQAVFTHQGSKTTQMRFRVFITIKYAFWFWLSIMCCYNSCPISWPIVFKFRKPLILIVNRISSLAIKKSKTYPILLRVGGGSPWVLEKTSSKEEIVDPSCYYEMVYTFNLTKLNEATNICITWTWMRSILFTETLSKLKFCYLMNFWPINPIVWHQNLSR